MQSLGCEPVYIKVSTDCVFTYRKHSEHICIVVDAAGGPILALTSLSVQPQARHSTGEQPSGQPHFILSEANRGQGGLHWGAGGELAGGVAKIDHAVQKVLEASDQSVQEYLGILHLCDTEHCQLSVGSGYGDAGRPA